MKLEGTNFTDFYDQYFYNDEIVINVFDNMVVFYDGIERIVLNRYTSQFTIEPRTTSIEAPLQYLLNLTEEEEFQLMTVIDVEKYKEVQQEMIKCLKNSQ
ncbi:hypothetical protein [Citrobacter sp. Cf081]|uniref:hypothetical protein n=1 Tax=Citrobacter sp. Cf081 TaxID=2985052 RepID=UPI0025791D24|nr:hypothetical protein [Citrobacter sp. Cf081]MDM3239335.1 hypothetical protein [Citrobacter sp. Cf081]